MAVRNDPNLFEFATLVPTEETAVQFAKDNGLLMNQQVLDDIQNAPYPGHCPLGTANCQGAAYETTVRQRGKDNPRIRCNKCKKMRSPKNAIINGIVQGN